MPGAPASHLREGTGQTRVARQVVDRPRRVVWTLAQGVRRLQDPIKTSR